MVKTPEVGMITSLGGRLVDGVEDEGPGLPCGKKFSGKMPEVLVD
jgi:hypothetical protein